MTPKQVKVMAAIALFEAAERLADATDDLIKAHVARRRGVLVNCAHLEEVALGRLQAYRQARADYERL